MYLSEDIPPDLQKALGNFERETGEIVESLLQRIERQSTPSTIYHYTNDAGLRAILETGKIWLSDAFSLNDPSELRHGFGIAIEALEKAMKDCASTKPEGREFLASMRYFSKRIPDSAHYFLCSFSACGDDLGQWRAYADDGCGYALGFEAEVLEKPFGNHEHDGKKDSETFSVIYDSAQLAEIHRQIAERLIGLISLPRGRGLPKEALLKYWQEACMAFVSPAMHASLFFKHEAYINEQEYRFLRVYEKGHRQDDVGGRARTNSLVKYLEFDWRSVAPGALKEIVVGPAANSEKAAQFAKDCIGMFQPGAEVPVRGSKIPYRRA